MAVSPLNEKPRDLSLIGIGNPIALLYFKRKEAGSLKVISREEVISFTGIIASVHSSLSVVLKDIEILGVTKKEPALEEDNLTTP